MKKIQLYRNKELEILDELLYTSTYRKMNKMQELNVETAK